MCSRVPKIGATFPTVHNRASGCYYLKKAKQSYIDNNYPDAYENFVNYFETLPNPSQAPPGIQVEFTKLACKIGMVLEETCDTDELIKIYLQVLNFFPNNHIVLNNLGAYMSKIGHVGIARKYLEASVKYCPGYLPAEKNLLHCKWQQVPRWHFRMLNDRKRNIAYHNAIVRAMTEGFEKVVDIGSGCGLLSLFASKNKRCKITAIEENKVLFKMCEKILRENNVSNVNLINGHSTNFPTPPAECNLLVTEIFDVAVFGERMLESLVHAHNILLTEEKFKIIPARIKLHAVAINSEELNRTYRLVNEIPELNLVDKCVRMLNPEPYDAEHVSEKNTKYLSSDVEVFTVDFYDLNQLSQFLNDKNFAKNIKIGIAESGVVHAIVVWFDLYLDNDIFITTDPKNKGRVTCWEQAVFYLEHPVLVEKDQIMDFKVTVLDSQLKFTYLNDEHLCKKCWLVSKDIIRFLNDEKLVETLISLSKIHSAETWNVMDLHTFPLFGFLLAKNGCKLLTAVQSENCTSEMNFFEHILTSNAIPEGNIALLERRMFDNPSACVFRDCLTDIHICIFDVIQEDGSLRPIISLREKILPVPETVLMPKVVKIKVILINSPYISKCNMVDDDNLSSFKVAKFMNEYSGNEHPNLEKFLYTAYSSPVTFNIDDEMSQSIQNVLVTKDGSVNALYAWYELTYYEDIVFSTLDSTYYNKNCYLIETKEVRLGDLYKIKMQREECYVNISMN